MELRELTAILGVSGDEGAVRSFILRQADACAAQTRVDRIGNVLAFKKGTAPDARHAMLCAHMDEVGLIVTAIEEDGLLDYDPVLIVGPSQSDTAGVSAGGLSVLDYVQVLIVAPDQSDTAGVSAGGLTQLDYFQAIQPGQPTADTAGVSAGGLTQLTYALA